VTLPEDEISTLSGYYTAYSGNSSLTFRDNLSVPSSRVKKNRIETLFYSWISGPFKLGPLGCPETSGLNYHCTLINIPK